MFQEVVFCFVLFLSLSLAICGTVPSKTEPALLVVSYDAFRPEYLHRNVTPNLNKFRQEGVSAPFMFNVFPTKTFVNHFSIATGLYAENHGVMANDLYDLKLKKYIKYSYELFHYTNSTVPIWTANEKAGKHSGCMMWAGSNFDYNGINCTFTEVLDLKMKLEDRIDIAISWFMDKKTPANLVMVYIEEPDEHGHAFGPNSKQVTEKVSNVDKLTGYIQEKLIENGLDQYVNVIHLSDHGMSSVSPPNFINLKDFVTNGTCEMYGTSPVVQVVPTDPTKEAEILANLTKAAKENGHFNVYTNKNVPSRWHANHTVRLGPIFAVAEIGYAFQDYWQWAKDYEKIYGIPITNETEYGIHGYDNEEPSMHAVFMAKGPLFAKGKKLNQVNTVDLYNLFCLILRIECGPNDGSTKLDIWNDLFAVPQGKGVQPQQESGTNYFLWCVIFVAVVVAMIALAKAEQLRRGYILRNNRSRSKVILRDFENVNEPSYGTTVNA